MLLENVKEQKISNARNYGVDALRLLAMFFVTILHTLGHGGVLRNTTGIANYSAYLIEIIAYCAVNCYAVISGFVMYTEEEKPYCYSKYITIWLQVFFYSFSIGLLAFIIRGNDAITFKELIKFALPVTTKRYWYFSSYTALFFTVPFLNNFIRRLSKKDTTNLIILLFVLFVCFGHLRDSFYLNNGYSFIWLAIMYLFGAWLKKCNIPQKIKISCAIYMLLTCTFITWLFKILSPIGENLFISYLSPTIVLNTLSWLVIFSKFKIAKKVQSVIRFFSPAAFGVYLIHEHGFIRDNFITDKFIWINNFDWWLIPLISLCCAFCIFVICLCIERIRLSLFKILKINETTEKIFSKIEIILKKFLNIFLNYIEL